MNFFELIKSSQCQKVLGYFFSNPQKNHYLRELAAILEEDAGNLSRTLKKLEKEEVLLIKSRGKQKIFRLNENHPLFAELKSLVEKTIGVIPELKKEISKITGISKAFIYGSWAREGVSVGSDIDLFLIGKFDEEELLKTIAKLEKKFGREINYTFFSEEGFERVKKSHSFVKGVLKEPKILILGKNNGF